MTAERLEAMGMGSYSHVRGLQQGPYKGHYAHLAQMAFTVGIMVSHCNTGRPLARWCYPSYVRAKAALEAWDGTGDPPGEWTKQKGAAGERQRVPDQFTDSRGVPLAHLKRRGP